MSFIDFLFKRNLYEDVSSFYLNESLDSSFKIIKTENDSDTNTKFYYIEPNEISGKKYRIFIERNNNDLHIGFERQYKGNWEIDIVTNDLKPKEILGLFGTINQILLKEKFISILIRTKSSKKMMLYRNLLMKLSNKLNNEFKFLTDDVNMVLYSENVYKPSRFKYKKYK